MLIPLLNITEKLHILLFSTVLMTSQAANHKSLTLKLTCNVSGRIITVRPLLITFVVD